MKNRSIPFGYRYENGTIIEDPKESEILKMICDAYIAGQSLLEISTWLNEKAIEYMPGIVGWNKSRLMRIMEDDRYLGSKGYPAILPAGTLDTIRRIKSARNTQASTDRSTDIFRLNTPVLCPKCGTEMHRRHDSRCKCRQRWTCKNESCREMIILSGKDLLGQITETLNTVIADPGVLNVPPQLSIRVDVQITRLENEISRNLDTVGFDKELLRRKMLRCLSLKYQSIDHHAYTIQKMKADFEKSSPLSSFPSDLVTRTVQSITLNADGTIRLTLINNQIIGKEMPTDGSSHTDRTA